MMPTRLKTNTLLFSGLLVSFTYFADAAPPYNMDTWTPVNGGITLGNSPFPQIGLPRIVGTDPCEVAPSGLIRLEPGISSNRGGIVVTSRSTLPPAFELIAPSSAYLVADRPLLPVHLQQLLPEQGITLVDLTTQPSTQHFLLPAVKQLLGPLKI